MRKQSALIFFIMFIIYEELIFSLLIFKEITPSFLLTILFSMIIGIFLSIITSLFSKRINTIISYILLSVVMFAISAQIVYYSMYQAIISFYSFMNGGQVTEFMDVILDLIIKNWYGIVLLFMPLAVLIILQKTKVITFKKMNIKQNLIKLLMFMIIQAMAIGIVNLYDESIYSNKNLYYNIHIPKVTASRMGILTTMRLDFQRFITNFQERVALQTSTKTEIKNNKNSYNRIEIDFSSLSESEKNEGIKNIHKFMSKQQNTNKNEYTSMFEGKNLVVFVAEAFSSLAIREDLTPTLYKLYNEGFQFNNFYTPIFPVSTADGEYITDTSLLPKESVWSIHQIDGNYMPYSYANVFEKIGYTSNAYHNHTATYYHRDKYIKTMGYNSYTAVGTGLEDRMNCKLWPNSDYEMINVTAKDYINDERFVAYYMTVSGHLNYTTNGNCMASKNWEEVKELGYSHKAKSYLATQIELDRAIEELIRQLEETGKLKDTVIVISGDHYPYGLTLDEINELSTYERDDIFEKYHMPFLIWNSEMKEPIKVEKLGSSLDVLPTILNLFGIEYDSRLLMGTDIFSDAEPIVIFSDRSFITDKGKYNSITGVFEKNAGVQIDEEYIKRISNIVYEKFQTSKLILENDYYKVLWEELGWEK